MSRTLPVDTQGKPKTPPTLVIDPAAPTVHVRSYHVITPLFGGGVEPQQADPVTTVRSSEVRGHLRFWWRATRAGRYGVNGLKQMKEAEDRLWGSTEGQSLVEVEVRPVAVGTEISTYRDHTGRPRHVGDPVSPLSYAAFPLRNTEARLGERRRPPGGLRFGVAFDLAIMLPTDPLLRDDVLAALWAWETFGGVGARTRRGFGALHCHMVHGAVGVGPWLPPTREAESVETWLRESLQQHVLAGQAPLGVPLLVRDQLPKVGRTQQVGTFAGGFESKVRQLLANGGFPAPIPDDLLRALVVWYYPIEKMKEFRQSRRQSQSGTRFGRSYWPEPDEIRWRFSGGFRGSHSAPVSATKTRTNKFPRAAFGLPIVFQFKDNELDSTTLQGTDHDRLASRLILRPLACRDGRFASVATILNAPALPPGGLRLKDAQDEGGVSTASLTAAEATFPPLSGKTDVLQAFLDTL
ncbi:MAG: type III-B CRISPR module RAMP protein Cmr1 [Chloroflexales bacterium]